MASTYTPQAAVDVVKTFAHGIPLTSLQAAVCDMVFSKIWNYYPWAWSINSLTAMTLSDGVQDYTPTDTDILRPIKVRIARTDITPNEFREKGLLANLAPERSRKGGLETISSVGWYASQNFFRLDLSASVGTGQTLQLQGEYQKVPTRITDSTMNTVFAFPDRYFDVFVEGLKWKVYQLADDPRAGTIQKDSRSTSTYTGQLGIFMFSLSNMARTEDLGAGDQFMWPEQPMGVGRSGPPGLYSV